MMYILTQEEYDNLKNTKKSAISLEKQKLQKLCTYIADTMPVTWGWGMAPDPKPWGCIIKEEKDNDDEWYCDKCPVTEICPNENKEWSK